MLSNLVDHIQDAYLRAPAGSLYSRVLRRLMRAAEWVEAKLK